MKRILTMKCSILVRLISVFFLASFLAGCGGGEDGSPGSNESLGSNVSSFAGTWSGTVQDGSNFSDVAVTVDNTGKITNIRQNGSSLGLTGTNTSVQGRIFSFTLSDGTEGGFMLDASGKHLGFLDDDGFFGMLELPSGIDITSFIFSDLVGTWSGYSVELDSNFDIVAQGASSATVNSSRGFSGSDFNGSFSGNFDNTSFRFGSLGGNWSGSGASGRLRVFLSTDKSFAATWACIGNVVSPSNFPNCTFAIWNKQ